MNIRKSILIIALLTFYNLGNSQQSFVTFPDSFKTSSKYYSPNHKPVSKSAMWGIFSIGQPYDSLILWPSTPLYNPNTSMLSQCKAISQQDLVVIVDTGQSLDCYEYIFWIEKDKKYYPNDKVAYIENEKLCYLDAKSNNQEIFKGYPVYIVNLADTVFKVRHKKYQVPLIQEALDTDGVWKPIETIFRLPRGVTVTNYYGESSLKPGEILVSSIYNYKGKYQTMLRVKVVVGGKPFYSNPFPGSINHSQITSTKTYRFN